jgi:MFS superfamily sulfate permease-like transporter
MKSRLLLANHVFLLLCASMYLGTGGSLVLFSFPVSAQLTPDNYYLQFVPQVQAATTFFTTMAMLMLVAAVIMLVAEWRQPTRWVPIVVLLTVIAATGVTMIWIFPLNELMAGHIRDAATLHRVLDEWMNLNRIRVGLWCVQWGSLAWYFARWAWRGRYAAQGL